MQHAEDEVRQVAERPLVELAARLLCHGGGHGDEWMELVGVATGQANQRAKPINACYVMYVCLLYSAYLVGEDGAARLVVRRARVEVAPAQHLLG